jgi:hypothetical protein
MATLTNFQLEGIEMYLGQPNRVLLDEWNTWSDEDVSTAMEIMQARRLVSAHRSPSYVGYVLVRYEDLGDDYSDGIDIHKFL